MSLMSFVSFVSLMSLMSFVSLMSWALLCVTCSAFCVHRRLGSQKQLHLPPFPESILSLLRSAFTDALAASNNFICPLFQNRTYLFCVLRCRSRPFCYNSRYPATQGE